MSSGTGTEADLEAWETRDLGVPAQTTLHAGAPHGPTPRDIPGGKVITTRALLELQRSAGAKLVLLEVLGAPQTLPNAFRAVPAAAEGDFKDATQQQFAQVLGQLTRGDTGTPIVTYCANPECWMSYNAALRAINAGYKNVMWYRGGLEAWQRAGQPLNGGQGPQQLPTQQSGQTPQPGQAANYPGGPDSQQPGQQQPGQQPGAFGEQPAKYPPPNGPGQPGGYPVQQPMQQPGGYPQQQPGGYGDQPPDNPQQPGGYPQQQPGGYPQQNPPQYPQN